MHLPAGQPAFPAHERGHRPQARGHRSGQRVEGLRLLGHQQQRPRRLVAREQREPLAHHRAAHRRGQVAPADADDVRHAAAGGVEQARDLLRPRPGGGDDPHRPGAHDVGEAEADPGEHGGAAFGPHDEQVALRAAALERHLVVDGDVIGEEEDVQPARERAMGLERRVLAGDRDERHVGVGEAGTGQRARARGFAIAVRVTAAPGQQALDLAQQRVAQAVLAVDGDHDVAGPRVGVRAQRRQGAQVGRRPHDDLAGRHAVALAQGARDAHEPHAVGVAVGERADLPAHAWPPLAIRARSLEAA